MVTTSQIAVAIAMVLVVIGCVLVPGRVAAQSDDNGLEESSINTFRMDPAAGAVLVTVDVTLRNVTPDQRNGDIIRQTYFTSYGVVVPTGAENIVATHDGAPLAGELRTETEGEAFSLYVVDLDRDIYNGDSTTLTVAYDHTGSPPRSDVPWRANAAYASFVAFGLGDAGAVTVDVVLPSGYTFDSITELDGFTASEPDETGAVVYSRSGLDESFSTFVSLSNDDLLTTTALNVPGADLRLRSWPDDTEWSAFATDKIESGIPELVTLIGSPWPIQEQLDVRQSITPNFAGYAGVFNPSSSEITIDEELDSLILYHELSHAWFNSADFEGRWINEGLAQAYSAEMVRLDGEVPEEPVMPTADQPGRQPLADWTNLDLDVDRESLDEESPTTRYGYDTSYFVLDAIIDDIGFETMTDVLTAARTTRFPYSAADPTEPDLDRDRAADWRSMLDYFERVGGSDVAADVFREYIVPTAALGELDVRAAAITSYDELATRADDWGVPYGVRKQMGRWAFDEAARLRDDANGVLDRRDDLDAVATETGITPEQQIVDDAATDFADVDDDFGPVETTLDDLIARGDELVALQSDIADRAVDTGATPPALTDDAVGEVEGFEDAIDVAEEQVDTLETLAAAIDTVEASRSFSQQVGLYGKDPAALIVEARAAVENGQNEDARAAAEEAVELIGGANAVGTSRITKTIAAFVALLLLVVGTIVLARRRRRDRSSTASGSGGVVDQFSDGNVDLDEDALTGTGLGGVDHVGDIAWPNPSEATRATGVVEGRPTFGDVRDPVLELDEHIGAVIDTDPVTRAEVLIDPHSHDDDDGTADPVHWLDREPRQ